ncbi:MAG: hypothetical protein ACKVU2_13825 [Saprospiraceae bacterium]
MKKTVLSFGILTFFVTAAAVLQFCVKPPNYPKEPVIGFLSLSKNIMRQTPLGQDTLIVTFSFTDGDGDIGFVDAGEGIFVRDGRDTFSKPPLSIPYIEQQGAGNGISGEISIVLPTTCCTYIDPVTGIKRACADVPVTMDSLTYKIRIKDRAGNFSNEITTPKISLICK